MLVLHKRFTRIIAIVLGLLLIPFVAMQITSEVKWNTFDFVVAGILLFGMLFSFDFFMRKIKAKHLKIITIAVTLIVFGLIWAELAVGIFGTPFAGN
jgi:hypothetical protein